MRVVLLEACDEETRHHNVGTTDRLAETIVDTASLVKGLITGAGQGSVAAENAGSIWDSLSSIAQNLVGFVVELAGSITAQL